MSLYGLPLISTWEIFNKLWPHSRLLWRWLFSFPGINHTVTLPDLQMLDIPVKEILLTVLFHTMSRRSNRNANIYQKFGKAETLSHQTKEGMENVHVYL